MTNEEIEKTMQFVLEQQAQFAANQQQVDERVSRLETNMAMIAQAQSQTAQAQTQISQVLAQVAQEQAKMMRAQTHMNEVVAAMLETHRHTEERLDAFIGVLERYISEDRNGKANGGNSA
jgi:hypothetical protein